MRAIVPAVLATVLTLISTGPGSAQEVGSGQSVLPVPGAPRPMSLYPSQAQGQYLGGVTQGTATDGELALSLDEAIQRGLEEQPRHAGERPGAPAQRR